MLNTKLSDEERYPLKLKNLVVMPVPPQKAPVDVYWLPGPDRELQDLPCHGMAGDKLYAAAGHTHEFQDYQHRAMSIDPSGRGKDETGYAVGFHLAGFIWVPEAGGLQGGYEPETLDKLAKIAKRHQVKTIVVESNFGDGMFSRLLEPVLLKNGVQAEIEEVRNSVMKEQRILDTLEPVVSAHKLIVDPEVLKADDQSIQKYEGLIRTSKSMFHQMAHICREKDALRFDDRVDALSMLVGHFLEMMNQDAAKVASQQHEEWLRAQLDSFHEAPLNRQYRGSSGGSWAGSRVV
jgi:hypothetical protein